MKRLGAHTQAMPRHVSGQTFCHSDCKLTRLFRVCDAQDYDITVPFVINGSCIVQVRLAGQGILPRLELADPTRAHISFGQITEGAQLSKQVGRRGGWPCLLWTDKRYHHNDRSPSAYLRVPLT
jgi:hypothetical protein